MKHLSKKIGDKLLMIDYHCDFGCDRSIVLSPNWSRFTFCAEQRGVRLLESDEVFDKSILMEIAEEIREIELQYSKYTIGLVQFCYVSRVS